MKKLRKFLLYAAFLLTFITVTSRLKLITFLDSIPDVGIQARSDLERYFHDPYNTTLINSKAHAFRYVINAGNDVCGGAEPVFLMIYVHSAPDHFSRRDVIRRSWANIDRSKVLHNVTIRRVFILGYPGGANASELQTQIRAEAKTEKDIVQYDFLDTYHNLSYKAIGGLRWISSHCGRAQFVLKTDDDTFVNMFTLVDNLRTLSSDDRCGRIGHHCTGLLLCNVWSNEIVPRSGKWMLPYHVWSYETWPDFCPGLAYVMTSDVVHSMYNASFHVPLVWLDDVYVTGFLPMRLDGRVQRVAYNDRYFSEPFSIVKEIMKLIREPRPRDLHDILFVEPDWTRYMFLHARNVSRVKFMWDRVLDFEHSRMQTTQPTLPSDPNSHWILLGYVLFVSVIVKACLCSKVRLTQWCYT